MLLLSGPMTADAEEETSNSIVRFDTGGGFVYKPDGSWDPHFDFALRGITNQKYKDNGISLVGVTELNYSVVGETDGDTNSSTTTTVENPFKTSGGVISADVYGVVFVLSDHLLAPGLRFGVGFTTVPRTEEGADVTAKRNITWACRWRSGDYNIISDKDTEDEIGVKGYVDIGMTNDDFWNDPAVNEFNRWFFEAEMVIPSQNNLRASIIGSIPREGDGASFIKVTLLHSFTPDF